jgi:hypothetical protein
MDHETASNSADIVFNEMDEDGDQVLSVNEFADNYINYVWKVRQKQIVYEDNMINGYEEYKYYAKLIKK